MRRISHTTANFVVVRLMPSRTGSIQVRLCIVMERNVSS